MNRLTYRSGSLVILWFVLIAGAAGIYFGYHFFSERFYISLYDGDMVRYLDIPPYSIRLSSADDELRGYCKLEIKTSQEQVASFLGGLCSKKGFHFKWLGTNEFVIIVRPNYEIRGVFKDTTLEMTWTPVLNVSRQARHDRIFGGGGKAPAE